MVAKGYAQLYGFNYCETFSQIARFENVCMVFSIAAQIEWKAYQFDVNLAFLNGYLDEDVYVEHPEGFFIQDNEKRVYKLKKAIYGLKQAPRACRIHSYLSENQFQRSENEPTLYIKKKEDDILIIL